MTTTGSTAVLDLRHRAGIDVEGVEAATRMLLIALGEDPDRDGLLETPARVARMWSEVLAGHHDRPERHLEKCFEVAHDDMVLVRDIPFTSLCEHHMLPFVGTAHVAYRPSETGKITGLSKLARVVDGFSKRLQVQERLTGQIADALSEGLHPLGVLVVVQAEHFCMTMRGIRKPGSTTVTTASRGTYRDDPVARAEVMRFLDR